MSNEIPYAYLVVNDQGYIIAASRERKTVERERLKGQLSHNDEIVPVYSSPPAPAQDGMSEREKNAVEALQRLRESDTFDDEGCPFYSDDAIPIINWILGRIQNIADEALDAYEEKEEGK